MVIQFLFVYGLKSDDYKEKKNGQTLNFEDLSAFAPLTGEILNLWEDFRKVVKFIDDNANWLKPLMSVCEKIKR